MGNQIVGESVSEKYLGDWISQHGTARSISGTIQKRLSKAREIINKILTISEDPRLIGFPTAWGAISEFETKVIPQLLNNAESWLGIKNSDLKILQDLQDDYVRRVFQVSARGTPLGMLMLDSQILSMKWRIILAKIRSIAKTMGKPSDNLCRRALIEGRSTCNGEDLLSECINWCRQLNVSCVDHRGIERICPADTAKQKKMKPRNT